MSRLGSGSGSVQKGARRCDPHPYCNRDLVVARLLPWRPHWPSRAAAVHGGCRCGSKLTKNPDATTPRRSARSSADPVRVDARSGRALSRTSDLERSSLATRSLDLDRCTALVDRRRWPPPPSPAWYNGRRVRRQEGRRPPGKAGAGRAVRSATRPHQASASSIARGGLASGAKLKGVTNKHKRAAPEAALFEFDLQPHQAAASSASSRARSAEPLASTRDRPVRSPRRPRCRHGGSPASTTRHSRHRVGPRSAGLSRSTALTVRRGAVP